MGDFDVIAAVSQTLVDRLTAGLAGLSMPAPTAQLHDLVGPVTTDPPTLTVFLYDITQDASVRNRPPITRFVGGQHVRTKQPLGLIANYMLTAWGGDRVTEQQILGRGMQVLYDDAIVAGSQLRGALAGTDAQLRVSLAPLFLEDRARVWFAIQKPYRLSVNYEVRVVEIDATVGSAGPPVSSRVVDAGVPA